jgi:hypothetical protein
MKSYLNTIPLLPGAAEQTVIFRNLWHLPDMTLRVLNVMYVRLSMGRHPYQGVLLSV